MEAAARRDGGMEGRHLKHAEIERDLRVIQGDVFRQLGYLDENLGKIPVVNQVKVIQCKPSVANNTL